MANNFNYIGEELKYAVTLTAQGFSMATDDFEIVLSVGKKKVTYGRTELINDGEGHYYLPVDTSQFKKGDLIATVYAYVPDSDYPDGMRTEIYQEKLTTLKPL